MAFCSNCGNELRDDAKFCDGCGKAVNNSLTNTNNSNANSKATEPIAGWLKGIVYGLAGFIVIMMIIITLTGHTSSNGSSFGGGKIKNVTSNPSISSSLTLKSMSCNKNTVTGVVTTDLKCSGGVFVNFKFYDNSGNIVYQGSLTSGSLNAGDSWKYSHWIPSRATKYEITAVGYN